MASDDHGGVQGTGIIPQAGSAAAAGHETPECSAEGGTVFGMLVKYGVLTILTLGIYRFWAKTHIRRYFWNSIRFCGDRFEYHGTPKELFIGFVLVVLILSPLFVLISLSETLLSAYGAPALFGIQVFYFAAIIVLTHVAVYRMQRYRLSRTSWRGVRFGLDGSTWAYLGKALMWMLATVLTIGLAYPWMRNALLEYRVENSRFGDARFRYTGTGAGLFRQAWAPALLIYLPIVGGIVSMGITLGPAVLAMLAGDTVRSDADAAGAIVEGNIWLGLALVGGVLGMSWYRVREFRFLLSNLHLAHVSLTSKLSSFRVILRGFLVSLLIGVVGGVIVFGIGAIIFGAMAGIAGFGMSGNPGEFVGTMFAAFAGAYFALIVTLVVIYNAIWTTLFTIPVLRKVCDGMAATNTDSLEEVVQTSGRDRSMTGEGLADALDVGAL